MLQQSSPRLWALVVLLALAVMATSVVVLVVRDEGASTDGASASGGSRESGLAEPGEPSAPTDSSAARRAGGAREPVVLAFAGDVHVEAALDDLPDRVGSDLGALSGALRSADLAMVNLEAAVVGEGATPASKELEDASDRYWFDAPPAVLDVLDRSGVDVATVANNHGADYGAAGLRETLVAGEDSPVALVGAGRTPAEAYAPYRTSVRGTDVAVLAADASPRESADDTWAVAPGAGPGLATARGAQPARLLAAVHEAARTDDVVVVYLHWGEDGSACPTRGQQRLAEQLAGASADVVVGSHAHVLLGAGMLGETYVGYGLGNFAWYHGIKAATGVLRLTVRDGRVVSDRWVPARIPRYGGTPRRLPQSERSSAIGEQRALRGCTDLDPGPSERRAERRSGDDLPDYTGTVHTLDAATRRSMRGNSHERATCPVGLDELRLLRMSYVGLDGRARTGKMVVHRDVAREVVRIFGDLYEARFPIRRMRLVDAYDGDDDASMAANNTSGYNCRRVTGQTSWSDHAYGRAIDINPVQNPYVVPGGPVRPPAGRRFLSVDRSSGATVPVGVIREDTVVTGVFARAGWTWGGAWSSPDYQHFSVR